MIVLRWSDLDLNEHITQSCYAEYVENALYEYDMGYRNGRRWIHQIGFIYIAEMVLNGVNNQRNCFVNILYDNIDDTKDREIIGNITQKDAKGHVEFGTFMRHTHCVRICYRLTECFHQ